MIRPIVILFLVSLSSAPIAASAYEVPLAPAAPAVDGNPDDPVWRTAEWRAIDKPVFEPAPGPEDFSGRYKLVWTPEYLFLLAEITDDVLIDTHPNPLEWYWEDDTLEIFIDEDASGGNHQFNYNAFAYHIALDNQVVDIAPFDSEQARMSGINTVRTFPDHVRARWKRSTEAPHKIYWEARIAVFGDDYRDPGPGGAAPVLPVRLTAGKTIGFMAAYCDADGTDGRQHFVGDVEIRPVNGDRNRGYIDASVFGRITLVENGNDKPGNRN